MPISGKGWELYIVRQAEQRRPSDGRRRTVGRYQVYRDGAAQTGSGMSGKRIPRAFVVVDGEP